MPRAKKKPRAATASATKAADLTDALGRAYALERPLPEQLRERLSLWIADQAPGTRLPSERALAEAANVNRLTLRKALLELAERGRLIRSKRGTVVGSGGANAEGPLQPHPLQLGPATRGRQKKVVRLALYESLPWQARFWRDAAALAGAHIGDARLETVPVPHDVRTFDEYRAFLENAGADLVQTDTGMAGPLAEAGLLRELSPGALARRDESASALSRLDGYGAAVGRTLFPVHFGFWVVLWNETLVATRPMPRTPSPEAVATWLASNATDVPDGKLLVDQPWSITLAGGTPPARPTRSQVRDRARAALGMLSPLAPVAGRLGWGPNRFPSHTESFLEGRAASCIGQSVFSIGGLPRARFPFGCRLPQPLPGWIMTCGATGLAVSATSSDAALAEKALAAFGERDVQQLLVDGLVNAPVRLDCLRALMKRLGCPKGAVDHLMRTHSLAVHADPAEPWAGFVREELAPRLEDVLSRRRDVDDTLLDELVSAWDGR